MESDLCVTAQLGNRLAMEAFKINKVEYRSPTEAQSGEINIFVRFVFGIVPFYIFERAKSYIFLHRLNMVNI